MIESGLHLSGSALERVVPFHVLLDTHGQVVHTSSALSRYWMYTHRAEVPSVRLLRPFKGSLNVAQFSHLTGMSLEVCATDPSRALQAELIDLGDQGWLLAGMPQVAHVADLDEAGVDFGDLPAHLGLGYLLLANEAARVASAASLESVRAREAAEAASLAKAQFLANMSHELRTPLTAILGFLDLCLMSALTERQQKFLQNAQTASRSLLALIGQVLDFSKIEAGAMELESVEFTIDEIVSGCSSLFSLTASQKGLEFRQHLLGEVPPLLGDPTRLGQVLHNLIGNAIKFTHEGWVELKIQATPLRDDRVRLRFSVTDTGIGIEQDQIETILGAFHQADASMARKYGGTGLGLTITARLVNLMGGKLSIESEPSQGTVFEFSVDFLKATPTAALPKVRSENSIPLAGTVVLVVDDHDLNRLVISEGLRSVGALVYDVADAPAALELLAGTEVDLVLLDLQMPGMDGYEMCTRLRAQAQFTSLPVVALTADVMPAHHSRALQCGVNAVLTKPISPQELVAAVMKWSRPVNSLDRIF